MKIFLDFASPVHYNSQADKWIIAFTWANVEKSRSWSSAHDWKSCIPHKGIKGSNPFFSARKETGFVWKTKLVSFQLNPSVGRNKSILWWMKSLRDEIRLTAGGRTDLISSTQWTSSAKQISSLRQQGFHRIGGGLFWQEISLMNFSCNMQFICWGWFDNKQCM